MDVFMDHSVFLILLILTDVVADLLRLKVIRGSAREDFTGSRLGISSSGWAVRA
jgi:hypothetical protein